MMRYYEITDNYKKYISETPISDISVHGDLDAPGSFNKIDRKIIKSSILDGTYEEKLGKIPFDLYLYIINRKELEEISAQYDEIDDYIMGEVHWDSVPYVMAAQSKKKISLHALNEIRINVQRNSIKNKDAVHLICGSNYTSGGGDIVMTPWIIIHRLLHTLDYDKFEIISQNIKSYETEQHVSWWDVGMMKSLSSGMDNELEMFMEFAVEFLYRGNIRIDHIKVKNKCDDLELNYEEIMNEIKSDLHSFKIKVKGMIEDIKGTTRYI
jgi:hypothetical protein